MTPPTTILLTGAAGRIGQAFRAAKDQSCRRVIYASSIRVLEDYPQGVPLAPELPVRPIDM